MFTFDIFNRQQIEIIENNKDGYRNLRVVNGDELMRAWSQLRNYAEVYQRDVLPTLPPVLERIYKPTDAQPLYDEVYRPYAGGWGYKVLYRPNDKQLAWFHTAREQAKAWMEVAAANFPPEPVVMKVGLFHLEWTSENNEPQAAGHQDVSTIDRTLSLLNGVGAPEDLKLQPHLSVRTKSRGGGLLGNRSRSIQTLESFEQLMRSLRAPTAEGKVQT